MIYRPLLGVLLLAVVRETLAGTITNGLHFRVHNGSAGEYGGTFVAYPFPRKASCGLQCTKTIGCWLWSHSPITSVCHVYTSFRSPMNLTATPSSFSSYGLATSLVEGYYVPSSRTTTMQNAQNFCSNIGMVVGFEPDVRVMNALHKKLGSDTIFVGLKRSTSGSSVWVDSYGKVVEANLNWQQNQPDNNGGTEDYTLSYTSMLADIKLAENLNKEAPVICSFPKR